MIPAKVDSPLQTALLRHAELRVAIADDEAIVRAVLKSVIRQMGLKFVGEASDGEQALALFRREKPHLLLLDYNMPLKNGDEVLKELKAEFPKAAVVVLTSVADMETVKACLNLGATDYLRKDQPVSQIRATLKEALDKIAPR